MRIFLLSFYPSLFILTRGIPVNLDSDELNLDSIGGEVAYNPPQQPIDAQTLSQPDNVETVALANTDSIFQNTLDTVNTNSNNQYTDTTGKQTYQNPTQSQPETTIEDLSQVPTQSGYDTNGELMAYQPPTPPQSEEIEPSTAGKLSTREKNCVEQSLKEKKVLCEVPSWAGSILLLAAMWKRKEIMSAINTVVVKVKNAKGELDKLAEAAKKKAGSRVNKKTEAGRKKLEELWARQEADGSLEEKDKPDENQNTFYREYFAAADDYNPLFLHKTVEETILESQPSLEQGAVKSMAVALVAVLEVFGPLILL